MLLPPNANFKVEHFTFVSGIPFPTLVPNCDGTTRIPKIMIQKNFVLALFAASAVQVMGAKADDAQEPTYEGSGGLWGYIGMSLADSPPEYAYGVSMYSTAWPLLEKPIRNFQIGLVGTWISPDNRGIRYPLLPKGTYARDNWPSRAPSYAAVFQTIEGSLGFWGSTRFGSATAKFRMNGTPNGYTHEISSPGWGFGKTTALRPDQSGIAQISQHLLVPPDGMTFKSGTTGNLFGYAWMALPLTETMNVTDGLPVVTGNQTWTMFVNTSNFKGPVACYLPTTWSRISQIWSPAIGRTLDARPADVGSGAIEINTVPRFVAKDDSGTTFTRIPTLQFPVNEENHTILMTGMTRYSKNALWNQVQSWVDGGEAPAGKFDMAGANTPKISVNPLQLKQPFPPGEDGGADQVNAEAEGNAGANKLPIEGIETLVRTKALDDHTFGLEWNPQMLEKWTGESTVRRGKFPAYFKRDGKRLKAIEAKDAPPSLADAEFKPVPEDQVYSSPTAPESDWLNPGPKAGPFTVDLTDGSVVTYYWYRFADQPSVMSAGFSAEQRERLQTIVEKIHREWTPEKEYIDAPKIGELTTLDSAMFVNPPQGMEVGFVPIVTRQAHK